jgi:hypothetical protein
MNATTKNLLLHLPVQLPPKLIWVQPMDNLGRRMATANLFQHTVPPRARHWPADPSPCGLDSSTFPRMKRLWPVRWQGRKRDRSNREEQLDLSR